MLRCAITDGGQRAGDGKARERLLARAAGWAAAGVDFVQLREKRLAAGELAALARELLGVLGGRTRLLINGRADVAAAVGAAGVHLTGRAGELQADQVRAVFALAGRGLPVVSVSCHSVEDVRRAVGGGADFVVYGPVFGKVEAGEIVGGGVGLGRLREAVEAAGGLPVLALGGVTEGTVGVCMQTGAAGVAGIRLFGGG